MSKTVIFQPDNAKITVDEGENLLAAAAKAGVYIHAFCGGDGVCGKCRVIIEKGQVEGGISERLSRDDIEKGYRLACRSKIITDLIVRIPVESSMDASALRMHKTPRKSAHIREMNFDELKEKGLFVAPV